MNIIVTYTEKTLLFESQLTLDQVQGLTWFWFQSVSWSGEALSEVLNSKSASPTNNKIVSKVLCHS